MRNTKTFYQHRARPSAVLGLFRHAVEGASSFIFIISHVNAKSNALCHMTSIRSFENHAADELPLWMCATRDVSYQIFAKYFEIVDRRSGFCVSSSARRHEIRIFFLLRRKCLKYLRKNHPRATCDESLHQRQRCKFNFSHAKKLKVNRWLEFDNSRVRLRWIMGLGTRFTKGWGIA